MKRIVFPLLLLLAVGCQREEELPEATSAAKEVYMQYVDRKDLTVALIGDYKGYNAVMLQAQDADGWLQLCEEFGVKKHVDAEALDSTKVSSLTTANFTIDSSCSFGRIGEDGSIEIPGTLGEFLTDLLDSVVKAEMGGRSCGNSPWDSTLIDTSFTFTHTQRWLNGELQEDSHDTIGGNGIPLPKNRLFHIATGHGNRGYIIHDDSDELTLWLFFYSTMDELSQIIDNIVSKHIQQ